MPVYDCGAPDCTECQRAFGPDRSRAIADYEARLRQTRAKVSTLGLTKCEEEAILDRPFHPATE